MMIENGIVKASTIDGVPVRYDPIPTSNVTSRPGYNMIPQFITVHNTGNTNKGADAAMHTEYVDSVSAYVSWHFTVDDEQIIQELPINENAWHAGDGSEGTGNRASIGIEICENSDGDWTRARLNGIKLIAYLLKELGLDVTVVVPHKKWSGKYCPHKILDEGWVDFIDDVTDVFNNTVAETVPSMYKVSWDKAVRLGIEDGVGPNEVVTSAKLMAYFDKVGLLDMINKVK